MFSFDFLFILIYIKIKDPYFRFSSFLEIFRFLRYFDILLNNNFAAYRAGAQAYDSHVKYRTRRSSKVKRWLIALFLLAILILLIVLFHANATRVLKSVAEANMRSITTVAVNDAIYYTLSDEVRYEDLITVHRDSGGEILAITSDALQINRIARDAAYMSQQNLQSMSESGVDVPLGAFFGVEAWAGFGPKIHMKIIPISNVACRFVSKFEEAGINQTKHSIYLEIVADISIIMPSGSSNFASLTEVLICESVLVGKIPETYLQADLFGNGYSLSPPSA